ncbi:MAG: 4-hydroxythreonine-4-phosphate dehydrogenase PdxA, partial [Candidatus Bathyarchaeota archaeon]|nr:4-hydroxythreonine-4-phosphate dehydrogenase PdxA [Candidatus Bathyarchaeota archaeon]
MKEGRPVIGVTMGDPAGVGPEIAVKVLSRPEVYGLCRPVLIGDLGVLKKTAELLNLNVAFKVKASPGDAEGKAGVIEVVDLKNIDLDAFEAGRVSIEAGRAAVEYIEKAVDLASRGEIDAMATGPINK